MSRMKDKAIVIKNLRKEFGLKAAVKDISLEVEEGTIISLLGVNGAGKTTTIRMLSGLSKPTGGEAFIFGKSIRSEMQEIKNISNLSTQETAVAPNLTVLENLEFMAELYGLSSNEVKEQVDKIIQMFSFEEVKKQKAKTLSGGWQRKVSIGMALITSPKILYLDEPTLGLDVLARRELWKDIEALKGEVTIVLTTHYMEEAEHLSDRVAVMVDGEIKACGSVEELKALTNADSLENAFITIAQNTDSHF
ncbi:ABC transporter ATP-binding protein [Robinsoniella sp. KNHs210]|uniref:ABC transporter ATP-binding protein n=1 Tax=Robinsoniella sp. KNHs210 TaxID=1469950 RepID=UPI00047FBA0C|nr:ABC transporter A family member [Robinsoniella sp. KNHs210]